MNKEKYMKIIELCRNKKTKKIYKEPVIINGEVEELEILNEEERKKAIKIQTLKSIINTLIERYPELKEEQYKGE